MLKNRHGGQLVNRSSLINADEVLNVFRRVDVFKGFVEVVQSLLWRKKNEVNTTIQKHKLKCATRYLLPSFRRFPFLPVEDGEQDAANIQSPLLLDILNSLQKQRGEVFFVDGKDLVWNKRKKVWRTLAADFISTTQRSLTFSHSVIDRR